MEFLLCLEGITDEDARIAAREIENVPGLVEVVPRKIPSAPAQRSGEILLFTELLIKIAPDALHQLFSCLATLFKRPNAPPAIFEIPTENGQLRLVFDPKTTPVREMVTEVIKLVKSTKGA